MSQTPESGFVDPNEALKNIPGWQEHPGEDRRFIITDQNGTREGTMAELFDKSNTGSKSPEPDRQNPS